ncbi:sensor histidine kinase [Micromonospora humi]|uniref:histidine kinase n=1 Tax=Micromonospora humi TaxID=745366 RepID=A0A1C5HN40_9ACTN|nr:sensor histidine kinase [Micromonospora humi]SCG47399.1 Signal transduction histidine kinase [Micromonospora humi]
MEAVDRDTRARRTRTALVWFAVALLPVVVLLASTTGAGGPVLSVPTPDHSAPALPVRYLAPLLVVLLPVGLLRRRPLLAVGLMLAGASAVTVMTNGWDNGYLAGVWYLQFLAIDVMLGLVAARVPRRVSVPAAVMVLLIQIAAAFVSPASGPVDRATLSVPAVLAAWVVGNSAFARRRHAEQLRAHAATEAVAAERLRIARELHDLVAHSIGVIAIQAGVGARVIDSQPGQARAALATIESTSRETLAGLRRTLGALRRPDDATASLDPTPGLCDLDRLVEAAGDAGVRVTLAVDGEPGPLPTEVELAAYRIVQEALTNVVRHARVTECRVAVRHAPDGVRVEVVDDGRGGPVGDQGHGIVGMRERAVLLGGRFEAGPRPAGGFRVAAVLPAASA